MEEKIIGPYKVTDSKIVYENPWISVREDSVIRPGGKTGIFGVVTMVAGSSVLPLDDEGNVYLVKEFKYGITRESIEVISGAFDKNETPLACAKRELEEELGLRAEEWIDLGYVDPFTTVVNSPNHMFLAKGLKKYEAHPDDGEQLKLLKVSFEKALEMVLSGEITHSASCVTILKAARELGK